MRADGRHCVLCGEPTSQAYCLDCQADARALAEWEDSES